MELDVEKHWRCVPTSLLVWLLLAASLLCFESCRFAGNAAPVPPPVDSHATSGGGTTKGSATGALSGVAGSFMTKKTTPSPKKTAPTPKKTVPAPKKTVPTPKKVVPSPKKSASPPKKTTPTPKKTLTPSPKKTTPSPKTTVPTPKKTTPSPKKTTPLAPKSAGPSQKKGVPTPKTGVPTPKTTPAPKKTPTPSPKPVPSSSPSPKPTTPTPSSSVPTGKKTYNGRVEMEIILAQMKARGYHLFAQQIEDPEIMQILVDTVLNWYPITIFAPPTSAFTSAVKTALTGDRMNRFKIVFQHMFGGKFTFQQLIELPTGTQIRTANYQLPLVKYTNGSSSLNWGTREGRKGTVRKEVFTDNQCVILPIDAVIIPSNLK